MPQRLFKVTDYKNSFAALRAARVKSGLTSGEAAKLIGMFAPDYSRCESGYKQYVTEIGKGRLQALAKQLDVTLNFKEASWSEIRQRKSVRNSRKSAPVAQVAQVAQVAADDATAREDLFSAPESADVVPAVPAPALGESALQRQIDQIASLHRLVEQGVLSGAVYSEALTRVLNVRPN